MKNVTLQILKIYCQNIVVKKPSRSFWVYRPITTINPVLFHTKTKHHINTIRLQHGAQMPTSNPKFNFYISFVFEAFYKTFWSLPSFKWRCGTSQFPHQAQENPYLCYVTPQLFHARPMWDFFAFLPSSLLS